MSKINNVHDKVFKGSMKDIRVAKEFFENHLPEEIKDRLDFNTLKLNSGSYVEASLKECASDILYNIKLKNGEESFIYLLCEHQSTVDILMPFRIWKYMIRIWDEYLTQNADKDIDSLPLIIPLVFYHGKKKYDGPRELSKIITAPKELIDRTLYMPFHLVDTHEISDDTLRDKMWAGVLTFVMKHIYARDFQPFIAPMMGMFQKLQNIGGSSHQIILLLNYVLNAGEVKNPGILIEACVFR